MVDKLNILEVEAQRIKETDSPLLTPIDPDRVKAQAARNEIKASPVKAEEVHASLQAEEVKLSPVKKSAREELIMAQQASEFSPAEVQETP